MSYAVCIQPDAVSLDERKRHDSRGRGQPIPKPLWWCSNVGGESVGAVMVDVSMLSPTSMLGRTILSFEGESRTFPRYKPWAGLEGCYKALRAKQGPASGQ